MESHFVLYELIEFEGKTYVHKKFLWIENELWIQNAIRVTKIKDTYHISDMYKYILNVFVDIRKMVKVLYHLIHSKVFGTAYMYIHCA